MDISVLFNNLIKDWVNLSVIMFTFLIFIDKIYSMLKKRLKLQKFNELLLFLIYWLIIYINCLKFLIFIKY